MIIFKDDISIKNAAQFYMDFKNELASEQEIILDLAMVKRIDLSIAQIIIAAGREAKESGKNVKLKSVTDTVKHQLQICGLKI
jgi:anti-anti-sigma regulatory factor